MNRESFQRLVAGDPTLAPHAEFLLGLLRPCVRITITANVCSGTERRFGGQPMVPADFRWPEHEVGAYYFLGQIN